MTKQYGFTLITPAGFEAWLAAQSIARTVFTLLVHRDRNRNFKRSGDVLMPAWGINHHGTRPGYLAKTVGMFSLGCSVRLHWKEHLEFIELLRTDLRYVANQGFRFSATYLDGGKVWAVPVVG